MRNFDVELFDTKTGEVLSFNNVEIDPEDYVGNLKEKLGPTFVNASIFFHNQLTKLEDDDIINDCTEEGDVVTGIIKYPHNDRSFKKDLESASGDLLVVLDNKSKKPIFLESGHVEFLNIKSLTWYPTILVFRKHRIEIEGQAVYTGYRYKLPKDDAVLKLKITEDAVCKVLRTGEMVGLPGEGEKLERLEGDFYKPIGKKLSLKFVNNGPAMLVLTGRQRLFDAFLLNSGQEARIEVKLNSRKMFEFGLCLPGTLTGENGLKELQANMFDAQKCGAGKMIRIDPPGIIPKSGGVVTSALGS